MRRMAVTLSVALLCGVSARAQPITFQGLDGAATKQAVLQHFAEAKPDRLLDCMADDKQLADPLGYDCDTLTVQHYAVAGRDFSIAFTFEAKTHHLAVVTLLSLWALPIASDAAKRLPLADIREGYEELRATIIASHGAPVAMPTCVSRDTKNYFSLCSQWQAMPGDSFNPRLGSITLSVDGHRSDESDPTYDGSYSVAYALVAPMNGL